MQKIKTASVPFWDLLAFQMGIDEYMLYEYQTIEGGEFCVAVTIRTVALLLGTKAGRSKVLDKS